MANVFTLAELAEHNTTNDCWITISGKVYNVSSFLEEHPGGDEVLLAATGKDATAEFDDVGHSHYAWAMMDKYYIGQIDKSTTSDDKPTPSLQPLASEKRRRKLKYIVYLLQFVLPLILLNFVIAFFSKSSA